MKTNRLYTVLIILAITLSSCSVDVIDIKHNDLVTTRTLPITNLTAIEVSGGFNTYITFSETEESIEIEANDNLQHYIETSHIGDKLNIKIKNNVNVKGHPTLNVYITTKSIVEFKASAATNMYLENALIANNAKINIAADSSFSGEIVANYLDLSETADAQADLHGTIKTLKADLHADANLFAYELEVEDLKIDMAADCDAFITVLNTIDIDATADCLLRYKGDAAIIHQHLTADSRIEKIN